MDHDTRVNTGNMRRYEIVKDRRGVASESIEIWWYLVPSDFSILLYYYCALKLGIWFPQTFRVRINRPHLHQQPCAQAVWPLFRIAHFTPFTQQAKVQFRGILRLGLKGVVVCLISRNKIMGMPRGRSSHHVVARPHVCIVQQPVGKLDILILLYSLSFTRNENDIQAGTCLVLFMEAR